MGSLGNWWMSKSVDSPPVSDDPAEDGADVPAEETEPTVTTPAGMCQVAQQPPVIVCEEGSGFLCVNTPEAGVSGNQVIIKGTIDRTGSIPASISVSVQHEYTKKTSNIDTTNPETSDCWNSALSSRSFCLDEKGFYAAKVSLDELGPYTVAISATRLVGSSVTQTVRTSRVKALEMKDDQVSFDPDVRTVAAVEGSHVSVTVSLLGDCQHCDFIGASTSGVIVTVENLMTDSKGNTSRIGCITNVEQGGQGKFVVGVPAGTGSNELTVTACNAATEGSCPSVGNIKFTGSGGIGEIEILSPPPRPSYSKSDYQKIPFQFKINGMEAGACVDVTFNRQPPLEICQSADGTFRMDLAPQAGINVVTIDDDEKGVHIPWAFGWGTIDSPFGNGSEVKDGLTSASAVQLALPKKTFTDLMGPFISNILISDELAGFISKIGQDSSAEETSANDTQDVEIPKCDSGSTGSLEISNIREPKIEKARIEGISFESNAMRASVNADNVEVKLDLVASGNKIPLKISFRKVVADLMLKAEGDGLILLTSPHTDCDFKSERYCKGTPAVLIPQNFLGNATQFAGIVKCDTAGADVSEEVRDFCGAFNSLNAQTGLMNEKVLDAINSAIYCGGSKALTGLSLNGIRQKIDISLGDAFGSFSLPVGATLGGIKIDEKGMRLILGLIAGDRKLFSDMPAELKIPSVGVVYDKAARFSNSWDGGDADIFLALAVDALNRLLFSLTAPEKGIFDLDISEVFFKRAGFDFVATCDAFIESGGSSAESYSPLCNIRPRVSELLGTPLTKYGYFGAKHPMLIRIRGNRALPPHISIVNEDEIPVVTLSEESASSGSGDLGGNLLDVQIGGFVMSFYALEVDGAVSPDEYGNLPVKLDSDGNPVIHSMRPEDTDPSHGQIASFELTLLLAVEIGSFETDPEDPSQFVVTVRPLADRSRLVISPVAGSNSTTIPPVALISALREKLQYAINIYSSKEEAIKIPVPKSFSFEEYQTNDLVKLLGLKSLTFGPTGLALTFDGDADVISLAISTAVTQFFHRGGVAVEDTLPH